MTALRCWVGFHAWAYNRPARVDDIFPFPPTYEQRERVCHLCHKHQCWLPGYGGSELGCWISA